jgi:hypothetical protein
VEVVLMAWLLCTLCATSAISFVADLNYFSTALQASRTGKRLHGIAARALHVKGACEQVGLTSLVGFGRLVLENHDGIHGIRASAGRAPRMTSAANIASTRRYSALDSAVFLSMCWRSASANFSRQTAVVICGH